MSSTVLPKSCPWFDRDENLALASLSLEKLSKLELSPYPQGSLKYHYLHLPVLHLFWSLHPNLNSQLAPAREVWK
jgi:hypothetical protein